MCGPPVAVLYGARQVKVESWPQAKQQRTPQARADLDAVIRSGLPASGPWCPMPQSGDNSCSCSAALIAFSQPLENCRFRLKSCRSASESCDRLDDRAVRRVAATVVYSGGIICNWSFNEALDSKIDDLVVVADSGVHFQQQATNLFR
jgi:hypothetical protein